MSFNNIILEIDSPVAVLTINRPPMNIVDIPTMNEMLDAMGRFEGDDDLMFLVLRSAGDKLFSAGVDVADHTPDKIDGMLGTFHEIFRKLHTSDKISIAVVQGHAIGGGCELAVSCDFVLASEDSSFSQPEIDVGCYPPVAAAAFPRNIGAKRAFEMVLTGKKLTAEEALKFGLVTRVAAPGKLEAELTELLATLKSKSRAVLSLAKKALKAGVAWEFNLALSRAEDIYLGELMKTEDVGEGITAFSEKRKPDWKHK